MPVLRVRTNHSEYLIDQENGTVTRTSHHEDANDLSEFGLQGDPKPYQEAAIVENRLCVTYADGTWSVSTSVQSVEEIQAAA